MSHTVYSLHILLLVKTAKSWEDLSLGAGGKSAVRGKRQQGRALLVSFSVRCFSLPLPFLCVFPLQALSVLLLPRNIPSSLNLLTSMIDDIWHYAGDQSTDVSPCALGTSWFYLLALWQNHGFKQELS